MTMTAGDATSASRERGERRPSTPVDRASSRPSRPRPAWSGRTRTAIELRARSRRGARCPSARRACRRPAASADQSTGCVSSASWPVTTVTARDTVRCVTGMPAAAGAASAELMPGTTSHAMPWRASASTSSPPRPNRNGSPPFSRTTRRPGRGRPSTSRSLSTSCVWLPPGRLPTSISSAPAAPSARISATPAGRTARPRPRRAGAPPSASAARDRPGPAPTSATRRPVERHAAVTIPAPTVALVTSSMTMKLPIVRLSA